MSSMPVPPCHIVAVPYPGRGHINAMVNLCRLLAARDGVTATVVVTEEWLGLVGAPAAATLGPRVRFEAIPNVVPSEHGRAGDMVGFVEAVYTQMEAPFERLLDQLAAPLQAPAAIVADAFVPWTVAVGARRGVPVCILCPVSATMFAVQYNFHRLPPVADDGGGTSPMTSTADGTNSCLVENYIPGTKSIRLSDLAPSNANKTMRAKVLEAYSTLRKAQCVLFTSFESDAIDALRHELTFPVYAVGPCIPFMSLQVQEHHADGDAEREGFTYTAWLDSQPVGSVLYVSLGSFLKVSSAQLDEIAAGLAKSKVRSLWALHDADARSHVRGLVGGRDAAAVVVPWTDQLRVLCHPSVGGFFTHCGMNSALEAVYAGVTMLTLPIAFDQPVNSRLVAEVWKTGLGLREKARADGIIDREEIAAAVVRLMRRDTVEAEDRLRKAALLKDAARAACEEGGSSWNDVTAFVKFISE